MKQLLLGILIIALTIFCNESSFHSLNVAEMDETGQSFSNEEPEIEENDFELACRAGLLLKARLFLNEGQPIDCQNYDGDTPLMIACRHEQEEIVDLLLEKKASINIKNSRGESALCCVINSGYRKQIKPDSKTVRIVKKLLEYGADPNCIIVDDTLDNCIALHYTPLQQAIWHKMDCIWLDNIEEEKSCDEIISLLLNHNASTNMGDHSPLEDLFYEVEDNDRETKSYDLMKLLIAHGADVNYKCETTGKTALHVAMEYGNNKDKIKLLLDTGADISISSKDGKTPLDCCKDENLKLFVRNYKSSSTSKSNFFYGFLVFFIISIGIIRKKFIKKTKV